MFDVIIKNGIVVNGTGAPEKQLDVGIVGDRIVKLGALSKEQAKNIIDVDGLIVAPGFIDIHSHSDICLLSNPRAESKIRQGVTTEVGGNCGASVAPITDKNRDNFLEEAKEMEIEVDWHTMGDFFNKLENSGIALNYISLVGHGTIRSAIMGLDDRTPTGFELRQMKEEVSKAMRWGAFGLSTGLIYTPGCFAETKEIVELCRVAGGYNGIYTTHMRGEGDTLIESVSEAIEIGRKAKIPVQISHLKAAGERNFGKVKYALKMVEQARKKKIDVTCDRYPYIASSTSLVSFFPTWARAGGKDKFLERLRELKIRAKIKNEIDKGIENKIRWEKILLASVRSNKNKEFEGKMVAEAAREKRQDSFNFACDLLLEENGFVNVCSFGMSKKDMDAAILHPLVMIGSDSSARAPYGVLGQRKSHPRGYGTFPRVIRDYVRERELLSLPEVIRKMTWASAQRLGINDRGIIQEGAFADLVVFDLNNIEDRATYQEPHQYPKGIEYVLVNGQIVVERGEHTGKLPGRVLKKVN
jgi:N-acyl-D-amino-acid deacylase